MTNIAVVADDIELDEPTLVEGLPGLGLVGKIATDHLIEQFDMTYYAAVDCDGIPQIAIYEDGKPDLLPPVRIYADEERDLLALRSDVPISADAAPEFADCVTGWMESNDVTPLYLSGLPQQKQPGKVPELYGTATGDMAQLLEEYDIGFPTEMGAISGPTGALLHRASRRGVDAIGLIVESDPQFPDPEAARVLLEKGVDPIAGTEVNTEELVESAEEIREQKEQFAQRMQQTEEAESSQAQPLRMFQ
ncbi:proteasome assembly chaperone family protein [Haladaptatus sp. AB618]|uniref:proteasome assembly chaperone family protein n=1 Tax=Haladaptatus sp. AB618 TaxID=2934173 RepID=UPI00209BFB89|nr:proteasome assembly chaperone family protein [Haladaptatus sp. AB618]MCO8255960.1 proteasome assembly chaperone family protein [Haladaptatus sp. AB618]